MAEHEIIKIRNLHPEWDYATYNILVHLDTDKVIEVKDEAGNGTGSFEPDPEWVREMEISTCPSFTLKTANPKSPEQMAATKSMSGEEVVKTVAYRVAAIKYDLIRAGVIPVEKCEMTLDELMKQPAKERVSEPLKEGGFAEAVRIVG